MTALYFILAIFFAWMWAQTKVFHKKRENKIPLNIQKIYWSN